MINKTRLLNDFFELLRINSPSKEEQSLAKVLKHKLTKLHLTITEDNAGAKIGGNSGNLIAYCKGNLPNAPKLLLSAHMDCVQFCLGVQPLLHDGKVTSDGTTILGADDKAGIASILEALHTITEQQIDHGDIQIIFTVAEEEGLYGSKYLDPALICADFGYCLDSSGRPGKIIVKAPGENNITIHVHGKSAHAGLAPEQGIHAITIAAKAITSVKQGRIDHETTANIGIIQGGVATNIIPASVELICEVRSCDQNKLALQTEHITDTFKRIANENGATAKIAVKQSYPSYTLDAASPIVTTACKAISNVGLIPETTTSGGGSDSNFFNTYGIPCAVLSVGMTKAHTNEEFILEEDLYKTTEIIVELIRTAAVEI